MMETRSDWIAEDNIKLSDVIKIVDIIPTENVFDIISDDQCFSLKPPLNRDTECAVYLKCLGLNNNHADSICDKSPHGSEISERESSKGYIGLQRNVLETNSTFEAPLGFNLGKNLTPYFDEIVVLSEARNIEVYMSSHLEYLTTIPCELLMEFEDTRIYHGRIKMDQGKFVESLSIKLKGLCCEESVWVYGIIVKLKQSTKDDIQDPIGVYLKDNNIVLSENGQSFKKLHDIYKTFQNLNPAFTSNESSILNSIIPKTGFSNFNKIFDNFSNCNNPQNINLLTRPNTTEARANFDSSLNFDKDSPADVLNHQKQVLVSSRPSSPIKTRHSNTGLDSNPLSPNESNLESTVNKTLDSQNFISTNKELGFITSIIDEKLKQLEETIVSKVEEKIAEANKDIVNRLCRIENLLLQSNRSSSS